MPRVKKTEKKRPEKKVEVRKPAKNIVKKSKRKTTANIVDVFDTKGKVIGSIELPKEIFAASINKKLVAQAVRVYLANQRKGAASTKTRGEVRGSTRKIWRQKGTGRARHGSIRAPIFVHGGVVFGPKPRDFSLKLSKKMRRLALFSALSQKFKVGEIKVVKGLEKIKPKTKLMVAVMKNLGLEALGKKVLLVLSKSDQETESVIRASRNIKGVRLLKAAQLNTYEVLDANVLLLMKESIPVLEETFVKGLPANRQEE